jgi:non-heme chloroperoxidase
VAKVVLIGSVTPSLLKTPEHPDGTPIEVFDGFRQAVIANRAQFMKDLATIYFGADRPGVNISEALLNSCWNQDMLTGFPAAYFAIKAFSETDTSEDLKKIDVPTLILHGDVDQIVPIGNAYRSAKLIPNASVKEYPGAPHAIISTSKCEVNQDLLDFIRS